MLRFGSKNLSKNEVDWLPTFKFSRKKNRYDQKTNANPSTQASYSAKKTKADYTTASPGPHKSSHGSHENASSRQNYRKKVYREGKDTVTYEEWEEFKPLSRYASTPSLNLIPSLTTKHKAVKASTKTTSTLHENPSMAKSTSDLSIVGTARDEATSECLICCDSYEDGDTIKSLPCFHEFHSDCIDRWLLDDASCPVCRLGVKQYLYSQINNTHQNHSNNRANTNRNFSNDNFVKLHNLIF